MSKYPALFAGLLASGTWTLDDLKKLAGLNFLRVLREVERVRPITGLPFRTSALRGGYLQKQT